MTAAPYSDIKIFQGDYACYYDANIRYIPNLDDQALAAMESAMQSLDMVLLGDLVIDGANDLITRGYCRPGGDTWGLHCQSTGGVAYSEFLSLFEDGASLTTTTGQMGANVPEAMIYRSINPDMDEWSLYHRHREMIEEIELERNVSVKKVEPTTKGIAVAIESFYERMA